MVSRIILVKYCTTKNKFEMWIHFAISTISGVFVCLFVYIYLLTDNLGVAVIKQTLNISFFLESQIFRKLFLKLLPNIQDVSKLSETAL